MIPDQTTQLVQIFSSILIKLNDIITIINDKTIDQYKRNLENKLITPSLDLVDQLLDLFYANSAFFLRNIRRIKACKDKFTESIENFNALYVRISVSVLNESKKDTKERPQIEMYERCNWIMLKVF